VGRENPFSWPYKRCNGTHTTPVGWSERTFAAYNETSPQEDLLVARTDGSQYRRLTDDGFRDRGPVWSPDGQHIAFYSDRSGTYEVWTIRPDGSGLQRITSFERANFPVWSPDGRRLAISIFGASGWHIIDSQAIATTKPTAEPSMDSAQTFWPFSWSAAGEIAGIGRTPMEMSPSLASTR
jgi:WD40 repeat protein